MSWLLTRIWRLNWRVVFLALFSVGILHICATITAAQFGNHPGYRTLAKPLPLHQMTLLSPVSHTNQPLPFLSPNVRYALCRFDTSKGSVEINVTLPDSTWTLGLHSPKGENIFTAAGQEDGTQVFKIKLLPSPDRFAGLTPEAQGSSGKGPAGLTFVAQKGLAIVRGPIRGTAYIRAVERTLNKANCRIATKSE